MPQQVAVIEYGTYSEVAKNLSRLQVAKKMTSSSSRRVCLTA